MSEPLRDTETIRAAPPKFVEDKWNTTAQEQQQR